MASTLARSLRRRYSWTALLFTFTIIVFSLFKLNTSFNAPRTLYTYDYTHNVSASDLLSQRMPVDDMSNAKELAWTTVVETTTIATTVITTSNPSPTSKYDPECETVRQLKEEGIMIVMKTGAQEVFAGLPIHLSTTLRCFDNEDLLIFSDLDQTIGQFTIRDVLKNVQDWLRELHIDFDIYRKLQQYKNTYQDVSLLKEEESKGDGRSGWRLDKYKFLHMIEETYHLRPNSKWYVFMETDTYYVWDNLLVWLRSLDSTKPTYFGSSIMMGDDHFAHGGSGYILSGPTMQLYAESKMGEAANFDPMMENYCCGDQVLGIKMAELGVNIQQTWPMTQGEKPYTIPYGPNQWCHPVVTMHHLLPEEVSQIWRYETSRPKNSPPMLYKDLYEHFMAPKVDTSANDWSNLVIENWDNLSNDRRFEAPNEETMPGWMGLNDVEKAAHSNKDNCEAACTQDASCFQWMFEGGICKYSTHWKVGKHRDVQENDEGDNRVWYSGWMVGRINGWVDEHQCEAGPQWVSVQ